LKFEYGLLDPTNVCNMELHKEGEGVLTGECAENEKRFN
jgi:hypothetical protein